MNLIRGYFAFTYAELSLDDST